MKTLKQSALRHRWFRLTRGLRKHSYDCGGSPYKLCGHCITEDWCRETDKRKAKG